MFDSLLQLLCLLQRGQEIHPHHHWQLHTLLYSVYRPAKIGSKVSVALCHNDNVLALENVVERYATEETPVLVRVVMAGHGSYYLG